MMITDALISSNEQGWETLFDADRDNGGQGVKIEMFLEVLRRLSLLDETGKDD